MENFSFYNPVRVIFGSESFRSLGDEAVKLGNRALVVSYAVHDFLDAHLVQAREMLSKAGVESYCFYDVEANPTLGMVERGVAVAKDSGADHIIGIGGGSVMDTAKLIAAGVLYGQDLWKMIVSRHNGSCASVPPERALPTIMVSTLPATGSEMNAGAVLTNEQTLEKSYVFAECIYPKVSIVDPSFTTTLPAYQTACGAADTISHALESYFHGDDDAPLQDRILEGVVLTVMENAPKALADPRDMSTRSNLQWTSIVAWNGWAQAGKGGWAPMHQIGHVLSARYNVAHGASLSIVMPAWMKVLNHKCPERYERFAKNVCGTSPEGRSRQELIDAGIECFENFLKSLGVPVTLSEVDIPASEIENIVADVVRISFGADKILPCVPPVIPEEVIAILKTAV